MWAADLRVGPQWDGEFLFCTRIMAATGWETSWSLIILLAALSFRLHVDPCPAKSQAFVEKGILTSAKIWVVFMKEDSLPRAWAGSRLGTYTVKRINSISACVGGGEPVSTAPQITQENKVLWFPRSSVLLPEASLRTFKEPCLH